MTTVEAAGASKGSNVVDGSFLRATDVVDWNQLEVLALAQRLADGKTEVVEVARGCFEWVRDTIEHCIDHGRDTLTCAASEVLREGTGYFCAKSHLLVALLRANWTPARAGSSWAAAGCGG